MEDLKYLASIGINIDLKQYHENREKLVICGMSGGVDSSVSALILKMMGYKVLGLFMRNWIEEDESGVCTSEIDYQDVIKVCEKMKIDYHAIDFSKEYKENVFADFLKGYENGETPNPDILCNKEIKFKVFFNKAMELGADYLATGHYCQVDQSGKSKLKKGLDAGKDQTYFLYTIKEKVLDKVLFPIGNLEKKIVRKVAKDFDLITHDKKDSTGICFIGERNFKEFLSKYITSQKGKFVNLETNKEIMDHDGYCFYTIGQRKGLGIGGPGGPWFVASKNKESNTVYVVEGEKHPALYSDYLICNDFDWVNSEPTFPYTCKAKVRYRQADQECTLIKLNDGSVRVEFKEPQRAIAVSQSVVFYDDDICLGGAVIKENGPSHFEQACKP